jgi:hypothetical protein
MPTAKTEVHVRVLYPSAFASQGVDTQGKDDVKVPKELADWLVASGYAEVIEPKAAK